MGGCAGCRSEGTRLPLAGAAPAAGLLAAADAGRVGDTQLSPGQVPYPLLGYWLGQTHPVTLLFRRCGPRLPHEVPRRPARQEGGGGGGGGAGEGEEWRG